MPTPAPPRYTTCHIDDCRAFGHVVMFATGNQFTGQPTTDGAKILLCLRHGGDVYDANKSWRGGKFAIIPTWLADDAKANRLPRVTPDPGGWSQRSKSADWPRSGSRPYQPRPETDADPRPVHGKPSPTQAAARVRAKR
jgi:hypothetical protein